MARKKSFQFIAGSCWRDKSYCQTETRVKNPCFAFTKGRNVPKILPGSSRWACPIFRKGRRSSEWPRTWWRSTTTLWPPPTKIPDEQNLRSVEQPHEPGWRHWSTDGTLSNHLFIQSTIKSNLWRQHWGSFEALGWKSPQKLAKRDFFTFWQSLEQINSFQNTEMTE